MAVGETGVGGKRDLEGRHRKRGLEDGCTICHMGVQEKTDVGTAVWLPEMQHSGQ